MKRKIIRTETYKKGVYVQKNTIIEWLKHSSLNAEMIQGIRYDNNSESYTVKITLTNDEINKLLINEQ